MVIAFKLALLLNTLGYVKIPTATISTAIIRSLAFNLLLKGFEDGPFSGSTSTDSVFVNPSGVISKIQERTIAMRSPNARRKIIHLDIQSGKFTSDWMQEYRAGAARFKGIRRNNDAHQIEEVGEKLRAMMPWIKSGALVDKAKN